MGNVYGVANAVPIPAIYATVAGADVTLTAGSEITIITSGALTALTPGDYYPFIWLCAAVAFGGSAPSALQFAFKIGAGSDVDTLVVAPATLVVSTTVYYCLPLIGAVSASAWTGSGSTINITGKATTNAATVKFVGSRAIVQLLRGDDSIP